MKTGNAMKDESGHNPFSNIRRRAILAAAGLVIASLCGVILHNAIYGISANTISLDKITLPKDIYMQPTDTVKLIPIGKMKGELDGEFEAFYLAIDKDGQAYLNRDPELSEDRYDKSKGWEPVTREQLKVYEKELHFIRHQKKRLTP